MNEIDLYFPQRQNVEQKSKFQKKKEIRVWLKIQSRSWPLGREEKEQEWKKKGNLNFVYNVWFPRKLGKQTQFEAPWLRSREWNPERQVPGKGEGEIEREVGLPKARFAMSGFLLSLVLPAFMRTKPFPSSPSCPCFFLIYPIPSLFRELFPQQLFRRPISETLWVNRLQRLVKEL